MVADALGQSSATWQGATAQAGYNPVNTLLWASLALICLGGIRKASSHYDVEYETSTVLYATPFILLGGVLRFLEDAAAVPFELRIFLVTPVIYLLITSLFIGSLAVAERFENRDLGLASLGLVFLAIAAIPFVPALEMADPGFAALGILAPSVMTALFYLVSRGTEFDSSVYSLAAFSQFFGGTVSALAVTKGYEQKQILAQLSTDIFGPAGILLVKTGLLGLALFILRDMDDRFTETMLLLALVVVGLATGLRVYLRVLAGI